MTIEVRKLAEADAGEVVGADTTKPLSLDDRASVNRALIDHCVLVFRGQMLNRSRFSTLRTPSARSSHTSLSSIVTPTIRI